MDKLEEIMEKIEQEIQKIDRAREKVFTIIRQGIKASGKAVEAMHNRHRDEADAQLKIAQKAFEDVKIQLAPFPRLLYSNITMVLEQEYVEARLLQAITQELPLPSPDELEVNLIAYLLGAADVIGELRRSCLESLLLEEEKRALFYLKKMESVYSILFNSMFPKNIVKGLRHKLDVNRSLIERTRADVTNAIHRERLRKAILKAKNMVS
ncbi:MAG: haloacid dehalogenase [Candidatus Ranarchaeia archaeon]